MCVTGVVVVLVTVWVVVTVVVTVGGGVWNAITEYSVKCVISPIIIPWV